MPNTNKRGATPAFSGNKPGPKEKCTRCPNEAIVRVDVAGLGEEFMCSEHWDKYLRLRLGNTFEFLNQPAMAD